MIKIFVFFSVLLTSVLAFAADYACVELKDASRRGCARSTQNDKSCTTPGEYAYWVGSCFFKGGEPGPIRELLNLPDNSTIPEEIYQNYDPKLVAKTLIYRYYLNNELPHISDSQFKDPDYDLYTNTQIQIAFNIQYLSSIIKTGFLNQFQTGTSNGLLSSNRRNTVESTMMGVNIEDYVSDKSARVHKVRPKYAYFLPTASSNIFSAGHYTSYYGEIFAVLKDDLKNRSTFTRDDSLNAILAGRNPWLRTYKNIMAGTAFERYNDYYETQIWGPVTFSDVKYLMINCPDQSGTDKTAVISALKKSAPNFPLFSCKAVSKNGVYYYAPDKLLYGSADSEYAPNFISEITATYAGESIAEQVKTVCDKNGNCEFSLSGMNTSDEADPDKQQFALSFRCTKDPKGQLRNLSISSSAKSAKVTLMCGDKPGASYKIVQTIKVISADYGKNVAPKKSDVTKAASEFCDGKTSCEYKVSPKFVGDPAPNKDKDFDISWTCLPSQQTKHEYMKPDATDKKITLTCD